VWKLPLPPAELARQDSAKKWRRAEVTSSDRTGSGYDQTCLVSGSSKARDARALHRRVRSVMGLERPVKL
jgi:microcompartment protein CcmK/EutM